MEFRIVLHLSNFYHDYRRESRVFISKQFITIAELEQHIAKIFNIDNFYLSCQNYFLPPTEDIRILHEDDGVWVWPKPAAEKGTNAYSDHEMKVCKKKKRKVMDETTTQNDKQENSIQSEYFSESKDASLNITESAEMQNDFVEKPKTINSETVTAVNNNTDGDASASLETSTNRFKSFKVASSIGALMESLKTSALESDDSFVNKTKRKRIRKHKRSKESSSFLNGCSPMEAVPMNSTSLCNKSSAIHLRFDDVETGNTSAETAPLNTKKEQQPIYNFCTLKDEDFFKYPLMQNTLPRKGDVITFKVLKINEDYSPAVSKNIIAKVIDFEESNDSVNLKILYGKEELQDPRGKFFIEMGEEEDSTKEMQWKQLLTPRLLFP